MKPNVINFEEAVAKDIRNEASNFEIDTLKTDKRRWLMELNSLKRDVELQLTAQKARIASKKLEGLSKDQWLTFKAREATWKVSALRFCVTIEQKMLYVKGL